MADIPVLRSKEQILGDLVDGFLARVDTVNDVSRQSVLMQFLNAVSQVNFRAYADIITMLDALSVDRSVGEALQRLARDKDVPILSGRPASGKIDVTDIGISKVSSLVYAGQPAPVAGSQKVYIADASKFSATGSIYIGRKTPNNEGPLQYISVQAEGGGAYWSITLAPTSLTTKFHNIGEEVVMAQGGDRVIKAGTLVQTPQGSAVTSVSFKTISNATIPDGEVSVKDIPVVCYDIGPKGNIPKGAIKEAVGLSFNASVTNPNPFSNGTAPDTDETLRTRIKEYEQTKAKGTEKAIQVSSLNVIAPDELKKVISSAIVRYTDNSAALVFDDGANYEPVFEGVGIEQIVDEALGGEVEVQLRKRPIAQARVKNNIDAPYVINNGDALDIEVSGEVITHYFASSDFKVPSSATLDELINSINSNSALHAYATTADNGTRLVIYPRDRKANDIKINSRSTQDANIVLGFPTTIQYTILLYKNDKPLYQDGLIASVDSRLKSLWSSNITTPETLIYQVDGAPAVTVTLTDNDFQTIDPTAKLSADTSLTIWAEVFNNLMPGITATVNGEVISFTSNRGSSNKAKVYISGGTLKDKIFTVGATLLASGQSSDYDMNLQTGQISLVTSLVKGDALVAGSSFTRAKFLTNSIPVGPTVAGTVWMVVDGNAEYITNSLKSNTIINFYNVGTDKLKITGTSATTSSAEGFDNIQAGDWFLIWTDNNDNINYPIMHQHRGYWRVESAKTGEIVVHVEDNSGFTNGFETAIPTDRFAFVRTEAPLQELSYGVSSLSSFVQTIKTSLAGVNAEIVGSKVRISTLTADTNGELFVVATNTGGKSLGASANTRFTNITSALGFAVTSDSEISTPEFTLASASSKIDSSNITVPFYRPLGITVGTFLELLNKVSSYVELIDSNKGRRVPVSSRNFSNQVITYKNPAYMTGVHAIQNGDRFVIRNPFQFDSRDTLTIIGDGDTTSKTYTLPVARKIKVSSHSTPGYQDFSADDIESNLDLKDSSSFYDFDFSGFKAWRQSFVDLTDTNYNVRFRSVDFGPVGDRVGIGFTYPTSIDQVNPVLRNSTNEIEVSLPVKTPRVSNWNGTTAFIVSKTTVGAKDIVTFLYKVGDEPDFTSTGANINIGDVVIINGNANFLAGNKDLRAKVTNLTQTSFTIEVPTGLTSDDAVVFSSVINQNGLISVTTSTPHNLTNGDRIGMYDTQEVSTGVNPYKDTYYATVLSPTQFTTQANLNIPAGDITAATHTGNVVTITSAGHGLSTGNVILVSNAPVTSYNGLHPISAVLNSDQFQYIVSGSSPSIASGRFDYQTYGAIGSTTINGTSFSLASSVVTINKNAHGLTTGTLIEIQSASFDSWVSGTTYAVGSIVEYSGNVYVKNNNTPPVSPPDLTNPPLTSTTWTLSFLTINGRHVIDSVTTNSFTFKVSFAGPATGGTMTITQLQALGKMARCLGNSGDLLAFAEVSTTAQELVDYVNTNYADYITVSNLGDGSATISTSTADLDLGTDYLSGTVLEIKEYKGQRYVEIKMATYLPAGTFITYNGSEHTITKTELRSGFYYSLHRVSAPAYANSTTAVSYPFTAYTPFLYMANGENFIASNNLQSLSGTPMFSCSDVWKNVPDIGEEIRLVAQNADQLTRFWNKLVVTGLSNIASIQTSEYGRQIQIMTNTFGSGGSVQIAGGTANTNQVAIIGSASEYDIAGKFSIPYEARVGFNRGQWITIDQEVRQNKDINLASDTVLQTYTDGLSINSGSGSFQTVRSTSITAGKHLKTEIHGDFQAFIGLDTLGLQNVQEGDWVRINNEIDLYPTWSATTSYVANDIAVSQGYSWKCLSANIGNEPSVSATYWKRLGVSLANEGIFPVVRTFGDVFWIENPNAVEEIVELSHANEVKFYSYDSVMPGDVLIIAGNVLGQTNIGRYEVVDEGYGTGYYFPTATRIYTKPIPLATGSGVSVGDAFIQVNIEESLH